MRRFKTLTLFQDSQEIVQFLTIHREQVLYEETPGLLGPPHSQRLPCGARVQEVDHLHMYLTTLDHVSLPPPFPVLRPKFCMNYSLPHACHMSRPFGTLCNHPTPYSRALIGKLIVTQLVKKFPAFYGTRRFITVFTKDRHWSLS